MKRLLGFSLVGIVAIGAGVWAQSGRAQNAVPDGDWRTINRDLAANRYSPLKQINTSNVSSLKEAWTTSLGGGATVPRFRGKGCHLALVRHRLDVAYMLGATLVMGGANFGSGSFRNQLRAGLRLAYIESGWRRVAR